MDWKRLLKHLKLEYLKEHHYDFFVNSGGYKQHLKPYTDTTANGLTNCIEDFIKHQGGYSNRISTTGMMRKINGQMKWTAGNSNKGAADVRLLFNGRSVECEVKIGADKMSEAQHLEKARIEKAGGVYIVVTSFANFLEQWEGLEFALPDLYSSTNKL